MKHISLLESFLIQMILYTSIWLLNEYVGTLLCIIIPVISFALLIISMLVELVEKSKVPKIYYYHMLVIIITPIIVGASVNYIYQGNLDWLKQ